MSQQAKDARKSGDYPSAQKDNLKDGKENQNDDHFLDLDVAALVSESGKNAAKDIETLKAAVDRYCSDWLSVVEVGGGEISGKGKGKGNKDNDK